MFKFLLVINALIAASLVGVILMQRSEGGGFAGGGSPTGFMSARGASDFLTRATAILATLFIGLSIAMAAVAGLNRQSKELDPLKRDTSAPTSQIPGMPPVGASAPAAPTEVEGGAAPQPSQAQLDTMTKERAAALAKAQAEGKAKFDAAQKTAQAKQDKAVDDSLRKSFDRERESLGRQTEKPAAKTQEPAATPVATPAPASESAPK